MRRPRQEVLDEGRNVRRRNERWTLNLFTRNVRRRNERWTFNLFNRPFWRPFGGAQRPQQRQQVVPYPPEFPVAVEAGPVEDVDAEDNEIDGNGERAAEARVTEFSTAGGTNIVLDPVNVNQRPAAWLHQWIRGVLPRSLRNNQHRVVTANRDIYDIEFVGNTLGLHLRQSKGRQEIVVHGISPDNARKDTIQVGDVVVAIGTVNVATLQELTRFEQMKQLIAQPERPLTIKFLRQSNATQIRQNALIVAHQAARIQDAHADYSDGTRRVAELHARINNEIGSINNEIGIELGYSGIDIVLGNIEPLEDEIDSFHQIPVDYYRTPGHLLLRQKVTKFLPSFHVPCVVHSREEPSRLLKPREKPTGGRNGGVVGSDAAQPQQQHTGGDADGTQQQPYGGDFDASPGGGVAATNIPPADGVTSVEIASAADPGASPGGGVAAAASSAASASSSSTRITATPLPPPTRFPYPQSSMQSSSDPSDCAKLFDWSKMVRDDWNTYLLLKEIISKNDVDSKSIAAIKALNGPNLRYHICNNQPVTVIIVCSFAPFGLYEGSPFYKFMELFFSGVSFLIIDLCPIVAPGGVNILGRKNNSEKILGQKIHNKFMTKLERILQLIRDNNRAIIVGWGAASRSGNLGNIIGNYHAKHPCCIYAGYGNITYDYDALVLGAKLRMKLFGNTNQYTSEKYLWWIKWEIMSTNRAFTQDTVNIAKKIEQSKAWNRVGMYIDYNFQPVKMPTNFWHYDEIKQLLQFVIAQMYANEVNVRMNIDWSKWDVLGTVFTRSQARYKVDHIMIRSCYETNIPRTRELFESLLDNFL